jgi:hypothetical protein
MPGHENSLNVNEWKEVRDCEHSCKLHGVIQQIPPICLMQQSQYDSTWAVVPEWP